jgi:hypothetical protein
MRLCHGLLCDRAAAVWMRGKAWCVPCSIKRFGFTSSAPVAEAGRARHNAAPRAAAGGGRRSPALASPAPLPTEDELTEIEGLERYGLVDFEFMLLNALEEMG